MLDGKGLPYTFFCYNKKLLLTFLTSGSKTNHKNKGVWKQKRPKRKHIKNKKKIRCMHFYKRSSEKICSIRTIDFKSQHNNKPAIVSNFAKTKKISVFIFYGVWLKRFLERNSLFLKTRNAYCQRTRLTETFSSGCRNQSHFISNNKGWTKKLLNPWANNVINIQKTLYQSISSPGRRENKIKELQGEQTLSYKKISVTCVIAFFLIGGW